MRTRVSAASRRLRTANTLARSVAFKRLSCGSRSPLLLQPSAEASLTRCSSFPNLSVKRPTVHEDRPRCCRCFFARASCVAALESSQSCFCMSAMFLASAEKLFILTGELGGQACERGARVGHRGAGWCACASATIARADETSNRRAHGNVRTARLGRACIRERRRARIKCDINGVFWDFNISCGALLLVSEEGCGRKHRGKQEQTTAVDEVNLTVTSHHFEPDGHLSQNGYGLSKDQKHV